VAADRKSIGIPFLVIGIVFLILGATGRRAFVAIGIVFIVLGIVLSTRQRRTGT
jgi:hypothetical protein